MSSRAGRGCIAGYKDIPSNGVVNPVRDWSYSRTGEKTAVAGIG